MLRNFVIFSLCLVATHATGEFLVLSTPKAVAFKGSTVLDSQYVGDVMNTVMGNPASADAQWDGLFITDPFSLVDKAVVVVLKGVDHIDSSSDAKISYKLGGDSGVVDGSLNVWTDSLKTDNVPICNIDFNKFKEAEKVLRSHFGNIEPIATENDILKVEGDKEFLQSVGYMDAVASNFKNTKCEVIYFHLSLESIVKSHSDNIAEAVNAASKLASETIDKLNKAVKESRGDESFVVVVSQKEEGNRRKREVLPGGSENKFNLATYYNQDYPVIFNIILWFMVTFGFSLLAICYAIGDMDPGRDSIIYRMTSTRMKKDN